MKLLHITPTEITPEVKFTPEGDLLIEGRSIPDNAREFYEPVLEWLLEYVKGNPTQTELKIFVDYYNTPSSKMFVYMIDVLVVLNPNLDIVWKIYRDDEDVREMVEILEESKGIKIKIKHFD